MGLKVKLLNYTRDGELLVASAAKLCYSNSDIEEIMHSQGEEQVRGFIDKLMDIGHESPIEHISYTFGVEGVSRALTHQLVRHRIASYSQQSQRYVRLDQFDYVVPPAIEEFADAKVKYVEAMEAAQKSYDHIVEILYAEHTRELLKSGRGEEEAKRMAEKKSIEDARYVFPNACSSKIIVTMNARSLLNFFEHRCCLRAQWEIRAMAMEMLRLVKGVAPTIFKGAGPACIKGPCPEGSMTCGQIVDVRNEFKNLGAE